jgi:rhodanese-related sulfurtransferase
MNDVRISPSDAAKRVESGSAVLLDVVGESAWRSLREVPRGAMRIPPEQISSRLDEIPDGRAVIAFCT